mgnify:CR=1 FL=1
MIQLSNPIYTSPMASVQYNSDFPYSWGYVQICTENSCLQSHNLTPSGDLQGTASYNFTNEDYYGEWMGLDTVHQGGGPFYFKFKIENTNNEQSEIQLGPILDPSAENWLQNNLGDVNQDGMVNVLDVVSAVNHIQGGVSESFIEYLADINQDGTVNILDVVQMIGIIVPGDNRQGEAIINRLRSRGQIRMQRPRPTPRRTYVSSQRGGINRRGRGRKI